jgi:DNA helicase-2/ATP-dependent DNA helicase PcrA
VEQRVEELADRPAGFKPDHAIGYRHLLPLSEIITTVLGVNYPSVQRVWEIYNALIARFGDEYTVLMDAPFEEIFKTSNPQIAEAIIRVREERVKVTPGYDGVYGKLEISEAQTEAETKTKAESIKQQQLVDFM